MGLIPFDHDIGDYCGNSDNNKDVRKCTKFLNKEALTADYNKDCLGKKFCTFDSDEYV
jgi:hypothetical protein